MAAFFVPISWVKSLRFSHLQFHAPTTIYCWPKFQSLFFRQTNSSQFTYTYLVFLSYDDLAPHRGDNNILDVDEELKGWDTWPQWFAELS